MRGVALFPEAVPDASPAGPERSLGASALSLSQGFPAAERHLPLGKTRMSREGCSLSCIAK